MANVVSSTLASKPFFLQKDTNDTDPIYYSASDMRRFFAGIMPRSGILGSNHFRVGQADVVGMAIKVQSGYANVGGRYLVHLPLDETIDLTGFTSNPASTRVHKVYLSVYDALNTGTEYAGKIDVVEDTGAGANPPATAAYYLQLATLTVAKNQGNIQNANIDNTVRHGGMAGEYVYLDAYLNAGFATAGTDIGAVDYRALYSNGRVWLSGAIKRTSPTATTPFANGGEYAIGKMHPNLCPSRTRYLSGPCSIYASQSDNTGTYHWRLQIDPDGTMTARLPTGTGPQFLMFDGMSFDLD